MTNPVITVIVQHTEDPYDDGETQTRVGAWLNPLAAEAELADLKAEVKDKPRWPGGNVRYTSYTVELKDAP